MVVSAPPPELTWDRLVTTWTSNVTALMVVVGFGLAYALGVRRLHEQGGVWPGARSGWFGTGLMSILAGDGQCGRRLCRRVVSGLVRRSTSSCR
jgi:cytochrome c oxidase assembly factor CtaG